MNDEIDPKVLLKKYLDTAKAMQLATSNKNQPWVCTVWFAHDKELNLYFISKRARRHSTEITDNPKVAGAIVNIKLEGLGQKVRGVTFQGTAKEVTGLEIVKAYRIYGRKWKNTLKLYDLKELVKRISKSSIYKITPSLFVLFDEVNFPGQPRQEIRP